MQWTKMLRRGGSSSMRDEFGDEISRLRFRLRRLYAIRRHVTRAPPDLDLVESVLRELIRDAERRLDVLEASALPRDPVSGKIPSA
jgi:hypothetical protein